MKNMYSSRTKRAFALLVLLLTVSIGAKSNPVDAERARLVAKNFLNNNGARSAGLNDVSAETEFPNVYVFTTENSFVLVAADDRVQPILGYSLTGGFDLENMPENKAAWIKEYGDGIRYAIDNQMRASSEVMRLWNDLAAGVSNIAKSTTVVAPLIQTQWDQNDPYNLLCPSNSVTGCVATAMAQVMKFWNHPSHGMGSHTYTHENYGELSADFQNTTYDWANMTNTYDNSSTDTEKMAVATLMYHCGVSVNMDYSPSSSGAVASNVADALKNYFNYSSDVQYHDRDEYDDATWISMLKSDLDSDHPIQYCGSGSGGGHSFVFDGYNSSNYFHVNWGWGGSCDEYYSIDNMNPGPGGIGSGTNGIYNNSQGAIFGVHPSECTANAPSNLTYIQNGRNITLSWSSASGAVSYNIYRDNELLGNVSSTSFPDIALYGSSSYYVRSMDSNGRLSLSSNAVTVTVDYAVPVVDDLATTVSGNNVNLSWTAPEWCYPQTPTETISYGGEGPVSFMSEIPYYAHRYPASMMSQYVNKAVYKVSTYIQYPGTYTVYIYTKSTNSGMPDGDALVATKTINYVGTSEWHDIVLDHPVILSDTNDLWVVMKQENTGQEYPIPIFNLNSYNTDACYYGISPTYLFEAGYNISWLIKTYITDGIYTYNIYRENDNIASNVNGTSYNDDNLSDGSYDYYVTTNYYGGESDASNQATAQIGSIDYMSITAYANPPEGGSVTGTGSYLEGSTCTLTAIANTGYAFANWIENGEFVSTDATYSFTVEEDRTFVANFVDETVPYHWTPSGGDYDRTMTLTSVVQIDGVEQTTTSLELGAFCGDECRGSQRAMSFYPTGRYLFITSIYGDIEQNDQISFKLYDHEQSMELDLTAPESIAFNEDGYGTLNNPYVLNFRSTLQVSAVANPEEAGTIEGAGDYAIGSTVTLIATANDGYQFLNWTLNGEVVSTNATYQFTVTDDANYVANFNYIHTQALATGWNWWSTYVELSEIDGLSMLENSLGNAGMLIKSRNDGFVEVYENNGATGWFGTLSSISNEEMYMVKTNGECEATIVSQIASPSNHPITIEQGWNWIGFPYSQSVSVEVAMSGFTPEADDIIKGRGCYASYYSTGGYNMWFGTLNTLEPGVGYMYKSNASDAKTLVLQTGLDKTAKPNVTTDENINRPQSGNFANNMNITAVIELGGEEIRSENYEVAAFVNGECRGSSKLMYVEVIDRYVAFLTVFGENNESMSFVLTDGNISMESIDYMTFAVDGVVGKLSELAVVRFGTLGLEDDNLSDISVYPNPTSRTIVVEGQGIRKVGVINSLGQTVFSEEIQDETVRVDLGGNANGVYTLRIVTDNGVINRQIIKK